MSEELYNSDDFCKLAEQYEELKKENDELLADKLHLIGAAMDGGDKYHYAAHDIGYRDMERKVKALEADYVISNRELLILQQRIAELEAERRWIPVSERLPEEFTPVLTFSKDNDKPVTAILAAGFWWSNVDDAGFWSSNVDWALNVTHWMPLPQPPEVQE